MSYSTSYLIKQVGEKLTNLLLEKNPTARKVYSVKKCFPLLHKTGREEFFILSISPTGNLTKHP